MTEFLCHADGYMKQFDATVLDTTDEGVVLDRTAFYPGGGGQPPDKGWLRDKGNREWKLTRISREGGVFVHELDDDPPAKRECLHGFVDWERRYQLMRTHTALHILCGVVWRDYGAHVTGGDMKPLSARMDFELDHMSVDFAREMEVLVNMEVQAARRVEIQLQPREEALKIPDLVRTKVNLLPPSIKEIRTVEIFGLDLQADGGLHVSNTNEVGKIVVVGHESKGRLNKRLRIRIEDTEQ